MPGVAPVEYWGFAMELIVCLKVTPHPLDLRVDPKSRKLLREGAEGVLGPAEAAALELALELKGRYGGEVNVLSLGPPEVAGVLTHCLGVGAHRVHLLSNPTFEGSDALSTARVLAVAIGRLCSPVDLVLCGTGSPDAGSSQIGPRLAAHLGLPQFCQVQEVLLEEAGKKIQVQRKIEGGILWEEGPLPAVLTVPPGLRELRRPSLRGAVQALRRKREDLLLETGEGWDSPAFSGQAGSAPSTWLRTGLEPIRKPLPSPSLTEKAQGKRAFPDRTLEVLEITLPRPRGYRKIDSKLSAAERFRLLTSGGSSKREKKERASVIRGKSEEAAAKELLEILREQNVYP